LSLLYFFVSHSLEYFFLFLIFLLDKIVHKSWRRRPPLSEQETWFHNMALKVASIRYGQTKTKYTSRFYGVTRFVKNHAPSWFHFLYLLSRQFHNQKLKSHQGISSNFRMSIFHIMGYQKLNKKLPIYLFPINAVTIFNHTK